MNALFILLPFFLVLIACIFISFRAASSSIKLSVLVKYMLVGGVLFSVAVFILIVTLTLSLNLSQLPLMFIYLLPVIFSLGEIVGVIKYFRSKVS